MKTSEQRLNETCREQTEAIVARHLHALFQRYRCFAVSACGPTWR